MDATVNPTHADLLARALRLPARTALPGLGQAACSGFRIRLLAEPARVAFPGSATLVVGRNAVLLLGPDDQPSIESLNGAPQSWRDLALPTALLATADRELGLVVGRRFRAPWARLSAEHYLRWRLLRWQSAAAVCPAATEAWSRGALMGAAAEWRRRPLCTAGSRLHGARSRFELSQQAAALIEVRWFEGVALDPLAGELGISSFHLLRSFRRSFGLTPHQYLLQLRLRRSFDLLEAGGLRIIDVAMAVGFSSHGHYSTAFRKAFGISPLQYQQLGQRRHTRG